MNKFLLTLLCACFTLTGIHAQIATTSSCDTNGDGKVDASDITNTINKVLDNGKATETTVIRLDDLTLLLTRLSRLESQVKELRKLHNLFDTNGHSFVDLALPSGTKWATCNIGATNPEDFGDYFAWGETETKDLFVWENYKWYDHESKDETSVSSTKVTKYCTQPNRGTVDSLMTLLPEDDAATVIWKGEWRTPTIAECDELMQNCEWTLTSINDVKGWEGKGTNGNTIFLPLAGEYTNGPIVQGTNGGYMTSSLSSSLIVPMISMTTWSPYAKGASTSRCVGLTVRPVIP